MKKLILTLLICLCFISCANQPTQINEQKIVDNTSKQNYELIMHPIDNELYVYKTIVKDVHGNDNTVIISFTDGHGGVHSSSSVHMIVLESYK